MSTKNRQSYSQLRETVRQQDDTIDLLHESLAELQLALEDQDWQRLARGETTRFTHADVTTASELARVMALKNPLVKRGLNVQAHYVWGQGVSIAASDPDLQTVVQAFLDDPKNHVELTSADARMAKDRELATDGNLFFVFFVNRATGRVRVRSLPLAEVSEVITNPQDAKDSWFYKRTWTETPIGGQPTTKTAYYPDWRHTPKQRRPTIGEHPVLWDTPIYHVKVGGFSDWQFGLSEIYAAIDWARAYKSFLEDWATITRAYSKFAWQLTTQGGKAGVQAATQRLGTTLGAGQGETNPPPMAGSVFAAAQGTKMEPIRTAGATTRMEDGRRLLLMVAAAVDLPETFFGDVSVGTLATATSLDRPTELAMRARQTRWIGILTAILGYVLLQAVKAPRGPLHRTARVLVDPEDGSETIDWGKRNAHLDVDFPPIVQIDPPAYISAIVSASAQLPDKRLIAAMILRALGKDDVDELLDRYYDENGRLKPAFQPAPPTLPRANTPPDDQRGQPAPAE